MGKSWFSSTPHTTSTAGCEIVLLWKSPDISLLPMLEFNTYSSSEGPISPPTGATHSFPMDQNQSTSWDPVGRNVRFNLHGVGSLDGNACFDMTLPDVSLITLPGLMP